MKISLLVGIVLLLIGFGSALLGILSVSEYVEARAVSDQMPILDPLWAVALPILSGLGLAVGGLLIGLSMGNWRNPRSHQEPGDQYVDPEGHHKMRHV